MSGLTTGAMCYYENTKSYSYISGFEPIDDNTNFEVIITGQNTFYTGTTLLSQNNPAIFTGIPLDTYDISEILPTGYTLTSIVISRVASFASALL